MTLMLTCEEVVRFIPDYQESMLPASLHMKFSLHMKLCKPCRVMLESLQAIPKIFQRAISDDSAAPSPEARNALAAAMARLHAGGRVLGMEGRSRLERCSIHPMPPFVERAIADGTADRPLRMMVQAYAAVQEQGCALAKEPFLPESVLKELPAPGEWRWTRALLNGCSSAMLAKDPASGASLNMILLPPGKRFPDHRHEADEHVLVLSGQVEDSMCYGIAGDWFHQASGTQHRELQGRGTDVCWTLTRLEAPGVQLNGWRGTVQSFAGRVS